MKSLILALALFTQAQNVNADWICSFSCKVDASEGEYSCSGGNTVRVDKTKHPEINSEASALAICQKWLTADIKAVDSGDLNAKVRCPSEAQIFSPWSYPMLGGRNPDKTPCCALKRAYDGDKE